MAKKQFKAESKRLLELMINSIYTNKEIFSSGAAVCFRPLHNSFTNIAGISLY